MGPVVVVVGGGTAGCAVAARLAEAWRAVTLIEGGPDYGPREQGRWPADLLDATTLATSHDWGYSGPAADGRCVAFDRARVIGGCSAHNGSTMSTGWSGDDVDLPSTWSTAELADAREGARERTRINVPDETAIQPLQRAFLDACDALGVRRTDDLLDPEGGVGASLSPVNVVDGIRWNTAIAYLDPVRDLPNLTIVDQCVVDLVEIRAGRVTGVLGVRDGMPVRFDADLVVLCAGAYGTPMILMRSGIGPAEHLRSLGIPVVVDLPGVGSTLQDQPVLRLEWAATSALIDALETFRETTGFLPEEQCVAKVLSPGARDAAAYDMHVFPWVEPDPVHGWRCVIPAGLLRPTSTGAIRLASRDPEDAPLIDHGYLRDDDDVDRLVSMLPWLADLAAQEPLAGFLGEPLVVAPSGDSADLAGWVRAHHHHYWHPTGGASIGSADDASAVCDDRARVRGVAGLVVADASLLPRAPRATTAFPVTVVGEHVARLILEDA
ncbi:MAG: GMC family oxidoreductase [Candidatus Nanopelagicales bacterium]|jgi:choline dehydrogenase|nr:GMC family oxidoreductase [Candidatus Nanopelagicales bacterium]